MAIENALVRLVGWRAAILHGDPTVHDRYRWVRRHLTPGPVRTLDAGCGAGGFTMFAARRGNRALGVSFNDRDIAVARERARLARVTGAEFEAADLRRLSENDVMRGSFDQVILLETIEHVLDDRKLLRDVSALLAPGGRLLLTTPFTHHRPYWGETISEVEDGGHVRAGYTHGELRSMLGECGLEVVVEDYVSGYVSQKLANLTWRLSARVGAIAAWPLVFPLRVLQLLDGPLTRLLGYPHLSVAVVARKPAIGRDAGIEVAAQASA